MTNEEDILAKNNYYRIQDASGEAITDEFIIKDIELDEAVKSSPTD